MSIFIKISFLFTSAYWVTNYKKVFTSLLEIIGVFWLFIGVINYFFNKTIVNTSRDFWIIIGASAALSVLTNLQKLEYHYFIKDKDIKIKLVIGDLFKQHGNLVIPANTTFDTTMQDDFTSKNSIQGQMTLKYYSKTERLDTEISTALKGVKPSEILAREKSKCTRYPIGTTIKLIHKDFKSYWLALSDVNEFGKPLGNFSNLQTALESLWTFISTNGHLERLVLPVLGSGKSGINASREKIIKEIINSFIAFSKEKKITEELVICIFPSDYANKNIKLAEINKFLEYQCLFKLDTVSSTQ